MRLLLFLLTALSMSAPAFAVELPARAQGILERGRPYVDVTPDRDGGAGLIRAAIDIAAPPEIVFGVITDCDLAPKMVDSLQSCRILERDPDGRWDIREDVSKMTFFPSVRNVFRSDYEPPYSIRFHRVDGDLPVFEGQWIVQPHGEGSRVIYENRVSAPFRVPGPLARLGLRIEVPQALQALRRESLARLR